MHLLAGLSRHFYHHVTPRTPHVRLYQKPANNVLCERSKVGQTVRIHFVCGLCQSCSIKNRRKRIVSCKCFRSQEVLAQQGPKKKKNCFVSNNRPWTKSSKQVILAVTLQSVVVSVYTIRFNVRKFYVLSTHTNYVFCMDIKTKSDYFPVLY